MSHHHEHHHHGFDPAMGKRFIFAILINLIYVTGEFYLGFRYDSVGLLADAGHNLSDAGGLLISLTAFFMLKKTSDTTFTYGYKKATVVAAFFNSLLLMAAVAIIILFFISTSCLQLYCLMAYKLHLRSVQSSAQ